MIGLVACCKTKLDRAAPVRELYTSPLFKLSLAYAEATCSAVYVISAQHDLLDLDQVIAPYERTMASLTPTQRTLFGGGVVRGLIQRHEYPLIVSAFAGAAYVTPIRRALDRMGIRYSLKEALSGMQIGERLSFLSRASRDLKPDARPVSNPLNGGGL